ncbi:hypothetical protein E8E13_010666 [Curvularia kusanoi]|uniref:Uncharacterized protein n=1 Tax=Curvularia kusanoi TaxID=90978 RepID=A0A9P4TII1_CURKU|nr:hypothetical protein E8E13_010666 [Curvularia kusanoi]
MTEFWTLQVSISELEDSFLRKDKTNNSLGTSPPSVVTWLGTQVSTKSKYTESLKQKHGHLVTQAHFHTPEAEQLQSQLKLEQSKLLAYELVNQEVAQGGDADLARAEGPDTPARKTKVATQSSESHNLDGSEQTVVHKTDQSQVYIYDYQMVDLCTVRAHTEPMRYSRLQ